MTDATDQDPTPPPALPREASCRLVEDADARGIAVELQGGETWYVSPLPLSPRGQKLADLIDESQRVSIEGAGADRIVDICTKTLDTANTVEEVEQAMRHLTNAVEKRGVVEKRIEVLRAEIAYHALRTQYRLSRGDVDRLVTSRHFAEILAALNGQETKAAGIEAAFAALRRWHEITNGRGGDPLDGKAPFARETSSAGAAAS